MSESNRKRFDARPDRLDLRDRMYAPPLRSLPEQHPSDAFIEHCFGDYVRHFILDQGEEGACTGFGLACVVNYLLWRRDIDAHLEAGGGPYVRTAPAQRVSPRMLYQLARVYDEWPGEDYEGSSCRGAMRGWFHHGVCDETNWPFFVTGHEDATATGARPRPQAGGGGFVRPQPTWLEDAASRPLGAYYRIDRHSIVDLQSALVEVGALLVSAEVHAGWDDVPRATEMPLPVIEPNASVLGVHAFAIVGYNERGFLIQNSWGRSWGYDGFAVLTYADWIERGLDAWVGVLGAKMARSEDHAFARTRTQSGSSSTRSLVEFGRPDTSPGGPLSASAAYEHTLVLGAGGKLVNRFIDAPDAEAAARDVVLEHPLASVPKHKKLRVMLFATGGLEDEPALLRRVAHLTPWFRENQIHPIFLVWQRGLIEPLEQVLAGEGDLVESAESLGVSSEAVDRFMEVEANTLLARAIWMQRKQDSRAAADTSDGSGGLVTLVALLEELQAARKTFELHLVSHSAGVLLHGHLLKLLEKTKLTVGSASFLVPACSFGFALDYLAKVPASTLEAYNMYFDVLSTHAEQNDAVGGYGQSLLTLMSRALEDIHKTPILGMQQAWIDSRSGDATFWHRGSTTIERLAAWRQHAATVLDDQPGTHPLALPPVVEGATRTSARTAHAVFDRRSDIFRLLVRRIRGRKAKSGAPKWLAPAED